MSIRYAMLALLSEGPQYGLRLREVADARLERAEADPAAPETGQVRAPLPQHRRELRTPR
ncbi:MAG TPA: hypothetical protein VHO07_17080 [Streptosporangiaceae bacterium]|jgi:hypothetical protein|nr:hypothetical protein [Streptosporangiaceae bacterium]HEX2821863.1 hypothetical protein [Streptosporangiaceae bacterium]